MKIDKLRYDKQEEVLDVLEKADYNGLIILPTGTGKARILVEAIKRLKPKGRIFYLCESTLNRDETFKKELLKWGAKKWINKIEFHCYQTAYRFLDEEVELCLADEADYVSTELVKALTNNTFKHIIAVSATLTEEKKKLLVPIVPVIYEVGLQEIEDQGLLNKTRYHFINYMLTPLEADAYQDYSRKFANLLNDGKKNKWRLDFLKIQRSQFLASLESAKLVCRKLVRQLAEVPDSRTIIFCGLTKQANAVCPYSYHSKSTENYLEKFDKGEINVLSVVSKINRGVNLNGINKIIFESPTRSSTKFLQRSGRGRRLNPEEYLDVYFLIPYYRNFKGKILPTIVAKYVTESTKSIEYEPIIYKL